jgi:hypothetical protein
VRRAKILKPQKERKMSFAVKDADVKKTVALPNGAATTYLTPGFDLGITTPQGRMLADVEWLLSAPALNTTQCPDAKTVKYSIMLDTVDPVDGSSTLYLTDLITQTGAGGAGAAAATKKFRLPSDLSNILSSARILGVRVVGSASGDASGATATLEAVF